MGRNLNANKSILEEGLSIIGVELFDYTDGGSKNTSIKKCKPVKSEAQSISFTVDGQFLFELIKSIKTMIEDLNFEIESAEEAMRDAILHLEKELVSVRAGKASPAMFNNVFVDYYGSKTALSQVANINTVDARSLIIKPWEKSMLVPIEKAIFAANLGVTPQNDGEIIRINLPPMTQERRRDLARKVKGIGEHAKVSIRRARQDANNAIKSLVKNGLSEDMGKDSEAKIQELTKNFGGKIDLLAAAKEKEILEI